MYQRGPVGVPPQRVNPELGASNLARLAIAYKQPLLRGAASGGRMRKVHTKAQGLTFYAWLCSTSFDVLRQDIKQGALFDRVKWRGPSGHRAAQRGAAGSEESRER